MSTSETSQPPIPADAFFPESPGSRTSGLLAVDAATLSFLAPGRAPFLLPLAGLKVEVSGIQHEILLLSHPDHPAFAISAPAASLVHHPLLLAQPAVAAQLRRARGRERRGRMIVPGCIAFVLLSILAFWLLMEPLVAWVAGRVPHNVEEKLGDLLFTAIEAESPLLKDAALDAELEAWLEPLARQARAEGLRLDFHLVDDPSLNAFALPGGHIVLHSGLLVKAEHPEEVLGVVAHEIAHVTERHSLRQMVGSAGLWVLVQGIFGDFSGLSGLVVEGGYQLLTLSFSREQEHEADDVGFDTLVAAGVDPRGLPLFFARLEKEMAGNGGAEAEAALSFLSTHPVTAERRQRLEARIAALPKETSAAFAPTTLDFAAFRDKVLAQAPETRAAQNDTQAKAP